MVEVVTHLSVDILSVLGVLGVAEVVRSQEDAPHESLRHSAETHQ